MMAQQNEILAYFAKYIEKELGIIYAEFNYFQLQNRLEEIAQTMGVRHVHELYAEAQKGMSSRFKQLLIDSATNNETSFFRDPGVFRALESTVFPIFAERKASEPILIWSAASSTGQEALSLGMSVLEWSAREGKPFPFSVLGTDISERALARAKQARYSSLETQRGLPPDLLKKYFSSDARDGWQAREELTKHTVFRSQNLKAPFLFDKKFDLVLCRNVLIYQNVPGKIEILKRISDVLRPGGFLILGAGESLLGLSEDFAQVQGGGAILYRRKDPIRAAA